jgi:GNAT superfamily N-acetyltransferase
MAPPSGSVVIFSPTEHATFTPYLAAIHASCITHDRTIATFLPPLNHEKLLIYWKEKIAEVTQGKCVIFMLLNESEPGSKPKGTEVMGVVMLCMPYSETGKMRGFVEKLLVSPKFRNRGGARDLMQALEAEALRRGKTLLVSLTALKYILPRPRRLTVFQMLDTETDSVAEEVYKKLGYTEVGKIPNYGISPAGGTKSETFFYKQL